MGDVGTDRLVDAGGLNEAEAAEFRRLRWRCRRGMRELDQLMLRYLERVWASDSDAGRAVFLQLLDTEDDKLWRWFMGYEAAADVEIASLIQRIRDLPP